MRSAFYLWLVDTEESLKRMIRGVFRFVIEELPTSIYRFAIETVGPVAIRTCRVLGLACLWLMILFGPFALACDWGLYRWGMFLSFAWLVVAILGSLWGLHCVKQRKAGL